MTTQKPLLFPYAEWLQSESFLSPYCLAQSGMPLPAPELLGDLAGAEWLTYPAADALPRLEARLAELFGVAAERIIVTPGATGAMNLCSQRWFRAGSRVAVEIPGYQGLRAYPAHTGAEVAPLERRLADGWQIDPAQVNRLLEGATPGHVLLTNPHNPSGAVLPDGTLAQIAEAAERRGGVLVSGDVYMEYATPEQRRHAALEAPNAVSIGSLSKAHGLSPLRIGWLILGEGLVHERRTLMDLAHLNWLDLPSPSLVAGRKALDHLPELLQPVRVIEHESRPLLQAWLRDNPSFSAIDTPFGLLSFPRVRGVRDTAGLARHLAKNHGLDVVPGEFFGQRGHLRITCGVPAATLEEGLRRLSAGVESWLAQPEK
ncbi:MAG: aspartate/methionine/tyrosine aminotransferase [Planctomycetota bacterium]|jgi:aspartate/methionine/tyrosine aminotransferase